MRPRYDAIRSLQEAYHPIYTLIIAPYLICYQIEGKADNGAKNGILDEEAERLAFQAAVSEWRQSGARGRISIVNEDPKYKGMNGSVVQGPPSSLPQTLRSNVEKARKQYSDDLDDEDEGGKRGEGKIESGMWQNPFAASTPPLPTPPPISTQLQSSPRAPTSSSSSSSAVLHTYQRPDNSSNNSTSNSKVAQPGYTSMPANAQYHADDEELEHQVRLYVACI